MTLFDPEVLAPKLKRGDLSQWHTPPDLARRMVESLQHLPHAPRVLEPAAGGGSLVEPLRRRFPSSDVVACELDPEWSTRLESRFADDRRVRVENVDYLVRPRPGALYDLALMNSPYEDGVDGRFLEKAMDESRRVAALIRLVALAGQDRYRRVWSQMNALDGWVLVRLAVLSARPDFGGDQGAKADFVFVDIVRAEVAANRFMPDLFRVEWW